MGHRAAELADPRGRRHLGPRLSTPPVRRPAPSPPAYDEPGRPRRDLLRLPSNSCRTVGPSGKGPVRSVRDRIPTHSGRAGKVTFCPRRSRHRSATMSGRQGLLGKGCEHCIGKVGDDKVPRVVDSAFHGWSSRAAFDGPANDSWGENGGVREVTTHSVRCHVWCVPQHASMHVEIGERHT